MWHQGFSRKFTKLREYFLCAKKTNNYNKISKPFWRVPENVISVIYALSTERKQRWLRWSPDVTLTILQMSLQCFCALIVVVFLLSMEGHRELRFNQKYLHLCFEDERRSYGFGTTWGWAMTEFSFLGELTLSAIEVVHAVHAFLYNEIFKWKWKGNFK